MMYLLILLFYFPPSTNSLTRFSVPESAPIGHVIGHISGNRETSPTPRYFVVFPDEQTAKFLKVDEKTGEISTISLLDYEKRSKFEIVAVKVDENGETVDISIDVIDENDCAPKFSQDHIKLEISEFAQIGSTFALPQITDGDGPLYDVHKFIIVQGNVNNVFKISSRKVSEQLQPELVVNGQLDREFRDKYELIIEAQDGGKPAKSAQLRISVEILDANDNVPTFSRSRYTATVSANLSIGATILQVSASDADIADNANIQYAIKKTSSRSNANFVISSSGVISTTAHLLPASTHDVIVIASDRGTPPLSSTAVVTISVVGAALAAPPLDIIWLTESNSPHLLENTTIGSIVARVSVAEQHRGARLELAGCAALCPQQTDTSHVYLLLLCGILDRETIAEYNVRFLLRTDDRVVVVEHPQLLTIGDVNDNSPMWRGSQVHISLNRTSGGSRTLTANDPDLGQNGWIRYSILDSDLVSIDKETGRIFLPNPIDCTAGSEIRFRVRAEDSATPPLFSDVHVIADLVDVDSKPPQFEKPLWEINISEDTPIGTCLVKVLAKNTQCGNQQRIRYRMDDAHLTVDSVSGTICIQKGFDFEIASTYQATVSAISSNAEISTTLVSIRISDANDNWPIFYPSEYQLTIRDGSQPSAALVVVSASDGDSGRFGEISYHILSDSASFTINPKSGEIFAKRDLRKGRYHLIVSAKDGGGQNAENPANVHITVIDESTRTPEFSRMKYEIRTAEDILPGIAIGSVAALSDGKIKYSIYSGDPDGNFAIDENTGKIYVTRYLDADVQDTVLLNVKAAMEGGQSNQTQVIIHIEDHNDNAPIFPESLVEITVREDCAVNEPFYVIHATDKDKKQNGEIRYSLVSSHPASGVQIDSVTGQISTGSAFDYETIRDYKIRVKATDSGIPAKSSNMTLFVHISDVNDNSPKFEKLSYTMDLVENSPSKTIVGRIVATDADSRQNGLIGYRITNGSEYFGIDEKLGSVYSKRSMDRESISHVDVSVIAEDQGETPRSTSVHVRVNILDVNDNPPSCHSITPIVVAANAPPSTAIGTIVASDPDQGLNGSVLYRAQLQSELFVIKANGDVFLRRQLNASEEHHQRLSVIVSDQGSPRKSAVCHVAVRIAQGSSSIVLQEPTQRFLALPENCNSSCRLTRFNATGVHTWQLQSSDISNHFAIRDGTLSLISMPSHRPPFTLVVIMSDSNGRQKSVQIRVNARSNGVPNHEETLRIADTLRIGSKVGRLGEKSADATFFYRFANRSDVSCPLELDQTTGVLYLAEGVKKSEKNFTCRFEKFNSTDGRIDEIRVDLEITKTASEKPRFDNSSIIVKVMENTTIGSIITSVNAISDQEEFPINYRFSQSIEKFSIDQFTGEITLIENLHWHIKSQYDLTVEAFTRGRAATTLVTILVEDVNDQSPKIISSPDLWIASNIRKGSIVHRVAAVDKDRNSRIRYELSDGSQSFRINSDSGAITIHGSLQRLARELVVKAVDSENRSYFDEQRIYVRHSNNSDKQWNFFEDQMNKVRIGKNSKKHAIIISYPKSQSISNLHLIPESNYFQLNGFDVIQKVDRVLEGRHVFTVLANADNSTETFDWTVLHIIAGDEREESPKISSTSCGVVSVSENVAIPNFKRIVAKQATRNAQFRLQGTSHQSFSINSTSGEMSMTALDRETAQEHLLVVILDDMERNDSCTVRVIVADLNDNHPRFDPSTPDTLHLNQSSSIGDVVYRLMANDMDIGLNGKISFDLLDDPSKSLDIVPETGALVLRRWPKMRNWRIRIRVFDYGTPSQGSEITIEVNNSIESKTSDHTFAFLRQSYVSAIDESLPRGQFVGKLETSEDMPLTYSIVEGNVDSAFSVDSDGVVRTNLELDREIVDQYNLKIIGISKHADQISTRMDVRVNNVNDNIPSFPVLKSRRISESVEPGTYIASVAAKDVDQLAPLEYFLLNKHDLFHLDRFTGVIHLLRSLDYETEKEHLIRFKVTDGIFENVSNVTILVNDVNDNSPKFSKPFYGIQISTSNFSPETPFTRIEASDADSGDAARITYSISDETGIFHVSPDDGSIYLRVLPPPGEHHLLTLTATDAGVPSMSSSVAISVHVGETGDVDSPAVEIADYHFTAPENTAIGMEIGNVSQNGFEYFYQISDFDALAMFEIDRFGRITTKRTLDREIKEKYEFEVLIESVVISSKQSKGRLMVTCQVEDENDNSPVFSSNILNINLKDSMIHGQTLGSLVATDNDSGENGRISYRILTGNDYNILSLNADSGALIFNEWNDAQLDESPSGSWKMRIEARDHGNPMRTSIAIVIVSLRMSSWSGSAPFFVLPTYEIHVLEDTPMDSVIEQVRASNRIGLPAHGLLYSLRDHNSKVSIDLKSGEIRLKSLLDWESEPIIPMLLSVSDGNGRSAVVPLKIIVEPVDEFAPVFTRTSYRIQVPVTTSINDVIGQVEAIDEDGGIHGVVRFTIPDRQNIVTIEESTGRIRLAKNLENRKNHTIETVNIVAYSSALKRTKTTVYLEIGQFDSPLLLFHSRPFQIGVASLVLLVIALVIILCVCICRGKNGEKEGATQRTVERVKPTAIQKQVYSVQTGEIRVLSGDLTLSNNQQEKKRAPIHDKTHSLASSISTSSDALRQFRGSSRSQMDSGIDPDSVSINSSVTDYLVSLGVNANPIPPRIRPNTTYDSLMNEYIYARVEDVLPPGAINLVPNSYQNSLLRNPPSTMNSARKPPIVPSFEPLSEVLGEIVEQRKLKEYVQVEI